MLLGMCFPLFSIASHGKFGIGPVVPGGCQLTGGQCADP